MTATSTARRWLAAGLLALGAATLAAAPAAAQNDSDPPKAPSILPQPNSGEKPRYQGAPGTASQYLAMGLTVGGVAMIVIGIAYTTGFWEATFTGVQRWLSRSGWPPL